MVALLRDRTPERETFESETDAMARIDGLADRLTPLITDARPQW